MGTRVTWPSSTQPTALLRKQPQQHRTHARGYTRQSALGSLYPWQPLSVCSNWAPGWTVRTVLGPSAAWHLAGTPGRPPSQVKAEEWSSPTPVASPRACTHGHQPRAWGAGSFRRPQRRGTEHGSENVPRHPPANQSSPLTGTGDRGPGQLSFPATCVTGSWPLREGGLWQTGNPGLATPWQPSSESGPGVGGMEGTPRGTGGFIFQVPAWSHSGGSGPIRGCKGQCGVRAQYSSEQPSGAASLSPYTEAPEAQKGEATCLKPHSKSGCLLHGAGTGPLGRSRMTLNVLS